MVFLNGKEILLRLLIFKTRFIGESIPISFKNLGKIKLSPLFSIVLFLFYFKLDKENINVDQFLWYECTENFFQAIKKKGISLVPANNIILA